MFGKRYDGRRIRTMEPIPRMMPYLMKTRTDSQNFFNDEFYCRPLDEYIRKMQEDSRDGKMTYMKILIAAMVRLIALFPGLNRFVMNGRIYARNSITVSFVVQKNLRDDSAETTVKLRFDGTENIFQISRAIDEAIASAAYTGSNTETDALASTLDKIPGFLCKWAVNFLWFLDRHDLMPKKVIEASPFHTSFFITNLKSLGINYIYHHVYEFGTTGIFLALGKEKERVVPSISQTYEIQHVSTLGVVTDERFCDGLYFARVMRQLKRILRDPSVLETGLDRIVEDIP